MFFISAKAIERGMEIGKYGTKMFNVALAALIIRV